MSKRGKQKGSRKVHVQCYVCSKSVQKCKLRLHIRKFHEELCPVSCFACEAKFVEQRDLDIHNINGCSPRRKQIAAKSFGTANLQSDLDKHHRNGCPCQKQIKTFFEDVDFRDSSAVNNFITKKLQLDEASKNAVSQVVDLLCKHLQHNLPEPFSIKEFVKGGSFGKGTAVKEKADIDCVVFLNNVKTMEEHARNLKKTMDCLESCLKQSDYAKRGQITFGNQTLFAVKFKFRLDSPSLEFDIDLLPTFTTDQSLEQRYDEMIGCTTQVRDYYSAGFVSLQKEFVKGQPAIVKDLIRLVKYWRKTCIEDKSDDKTRLPSSYPLELITIHCWEKAGKPEPFDIRVGFKAVLKQLVDNCNLNVRWYKCYNKALAKRGTKGMSKSPPFVLDPANPTNNVCSASNAEGWKTVADVAKMTLKDIIVKRKWQI